MVLQHYLQEKYGSDSPGSDRFKSEVGEYHASHVADCERKMWYRFNIGSSSSDASPYFELGRIHERVYGAALASKFDDVDENQRPDQITDESWRVVQDVEMEVVFYDDVRLVGESDWVVLREEAKDEVEMRGRLERIDVSSTGERLVTWEDGSQTSLEPDEKTPVEFVVETKTTGKITDMRVDGYQTGHVYQLYSYMLAFNCPGQIAYIQRDDLQEVVFDLERSEEAMMDVKLRVKRHHDNIQSNKIPDSTPNNRWDCHYCDYQDECRRAGGSEYL